jgi:hypothetical protein
MKKVPPELDQIVDIVLAYKPKKKTKKKGEKRVKKSQRESNI